MNNSNDENNIVDFDKEKSPFVHIRKEQKLQKVKNAFKKALPINTKPKKKTKKKKKK